MDPRQMFRKKALEKLQSPDQLDELLTITSPQGWLLLATIAVLMIAALAWAGFGTLQTATDGQGVLTATQDPNTLEAVMYVSLTDGQRIRPGMNAKISPLSFPQEAFGLLVGQVTSVNATPATQKRMIDVVHNDAFAQSLIANGSLIEVHVQLVKNAATPSGYSWTSATGAPTTLQNGTLAKGQIVIYQQRPISLLFP